MRASRLVNADLILKEYLGLDQIPGRSRVRNSWKYIDVKYQP